MKKVTFFQTWGWQRVLTLGLSLRARTMLGALFPVAGISLSLLHNLNTEKQLEMNQVLSQARRAAVGELTRAFNRATETIRQQRDQLLRETITDGLTGAYNQRHFQHLLRQEIERALRSGDSMSLLMIDVDHFKKYNDTHGHEFGNNVLKKIRARRRRSEHFGSRETI